MPADFWYQIATIIQDNHVCVLIVLRCGSSENSKVVCFRYLVSQGPTQSVCTDTPLTNPSLRALAPPLNRARALRIHEWIDGNWWRRIVQAAWDVVRILRQEQNHEKHQAWEVARFQNSGLIRKLSNRFSAANSENLKNHQNHSHSLIRWEKRLQIISLNAKIPILFTRLQLYRFYR